MRKEALSLALPIALSLGCKPKNPSTETAYDNCTDAPTFDYAPILETAADPNDLCTDIAAHIETVICYLDRGWETFLYDWSFERESENGDIMYVSDVWADWSVDGEMICSHEAYVDEDGNTRESVSCDLWNYETVEDIVFWLFQDREYPELTDVGVSLVMPEDVVPAGAGDWVIYGVFIDGEAGETYEADTPYAWVNQDQLYTTACAPEYEATINDFAERMSEIAHRVVDR